MLLFKIRLYVYIRYIFFQIVINDDYVEEMMAYYVSFTWTVEKYVSLMSTLEAHIKSHAGLIVNIDIGIWRAVGHGKVLSCQNINQEPGVAFPPIPGKGHQNT